MADSCQVSQTILPDNGVVIRLNGDRAGIIDHVHTGALTAEKGNIIELQADMMRARRRMLWNGVVTASVILNKAGALCTVPSIAQSGLADAAAGSDYVSAASIAVEDAIEILGKTARRNDASVEDVVSQAVRRVARSMFGLRPIAQVHIMRIGEEDLRA